LERERQAAAAAAKNGPTPLQYMIQTMNDPSVDQHRRDRMALEAAPYMHPKLTAIAVGPSDGSPSSNLTVTTINVISVPSGLSHDLQPIDVTRQRLASPLLESVEVEEVGEGEHEPELEPAPALEPSEQLPDEA
jgi:hypothetical protein